MVLRLKLTFPVNVSLSCDWLCVMLIQDHVALGEITFTTQKVLYSENRLF